MEDLLKNPDSNHHGARWAKLVRGGVMESYGSLTWYEVATLATRKAIEESP